MQPVSRLRTSFGLFHFRLAILIVSLLLLASSQGHEAKNADKSSSNEGGFSLKSFKVPNVFNFDKFVSRFGKVYKTSTEKTARVKIYLAQALKAFVSAVKYKLARSKYFLAVNQMSDRTPGELAALSNRHLISPSNVDENLDELSVASPDDIEKQLKYVVKHKRDNPVLDLIASELQGERKTVTADILSSGFLNPGLKKASAFRKNSSPEHALSPVMASKIMKLPGKIMGIFGSKKRSAKMLKNDLVNAWQDSESDREAAEDKLVKLDKSASKPKKNNVDHRTSRCLSMVKDQGSQCGSCYIFSVIALYEYAYCIQNKELIEFSERYVLDCGKARFGLKGCDGGQERDVAQFTDNYGLELARNLPYNSDESTCPWSDDVKRKAMGYFLVKDAGIKAINPSNFYYYLERMPIIISLFTPDDFHSFGGGVHTPGHCDQGSLHSVLAIGFGEENGEKYILIRNSHSVRFGEEGHYKLNQKSFSDCVLQKDLLVSKSLYKKKTFINGKNPNYKSVEVQHFSYPYENHEPMPTPQPTNYHNPTDGFNNYQPYQPETEGYQLPWQRPPLMPDLPVADDYQSSWHTNNPSFDPRPSWEQSVVDNYFHYDWVPDETNWKHDNTFGQTENTGFFSTLYNMFDTDNSNQPQKPEYQYDQRNNDYYTPSETGMIDSIQSFFGWDTKHDDQGHWSQQNQYNYYDNYQQPNQGYHDQGFSQYSGPSTADSYSFKDSIMNLFNYDPPPAYSQETPSEHQPQPNPQSQPQPEPNPEDKKPLVENRPNKVETTMPPPSDKKPEATTELAPTRESWEYVPEIMDYNNPGQYLSQYRSYW